MSPNLDRTTGYQCQPWRDINLERFSEHKNNSVPTGQHHGYNIWRRGMNLVYANYDTDNKLCVFQEVEGEDFGKVLEDVFFKLFR